MQGCHLVERSQQADQRQTTRKRPINVPEPPAPPSRMTGSQWLDQGTASSSSGHRNYGYTYDQPSYYRVSPHTSNVEYVPGRRPDGSVGMALVLPALTDCRWWFESLLVHSGVSSATRRKATGADYKKM